MTDIVDIKTQLDLLEDFLVREMDNIRFDYFVIKPGGCVRGNQSLVDNDSSPTPPTSSSESGSGPLPYDNLSGQHLGTNACAPSIPRVLVNNSGRKSKAIDIINPVTGEKVQF